MCATSICFILCCKEHINISFFNLFQTPRTVNLIETPYSLILSVRGSLCCPYRPPYLTYTHTHTHMADVLHLSEMIWTFGCFMSFHVGMRRSLLLNLIICCPLRGLPCSDWIQYLSSYYLALSVTDR